MTAAHPTLRTAMEDTRARLRGHADVLGYGVGVPHRDRDGEFRAGNHTLGGMALKVFVREKKRRVPAKQRLPKRVRQRRHARDPYSGSCDVPVDLVSVGETTTDVGCGSRPFPVAGKLIPGRMFAYFAPNNSSASNATNCGTVGALLRTADQTRSWIISAGHVFVDLCNLALPVRQGTSKIRSKAGVVTRVTEADFTPSSLFVRQGEIGDFSVVEVPPGDCTPDWPPDFTGEIATAKDREDAFARAGERTCFLWVERPGPTGESARAVVEADFETAVNRKTHFARCGGGQVPWDYLSVWQYRFPGAKALSLPGDSGCPVFLRRKTDTGFVPVLLGFHVLASLDEPIAFCEDALAIISTTFVKPEGGFNSLLWT